MSTRFVVEKPDLLAFDDTGTVLFHGAPSGNPVLKLVRSEAQSCIVLLDPYAGPMDRPYENLVSCDSAGRIRWRASLPDIGADAYLEAVDADGVIRARSWSGFQVVIDPSNGRLISTEFVK